MLVGCIIQKGLSLDGPKVIIIIIIIIIGSYLAHFHTVQCALSSYISPYASLKSSVLTLSVRMTPTGVAFILPSLPGDAYRRAK